MSTQHTVEQGECLSTIAEQYGYYWQTLWDFPENADLRAKRGSPDILMPGDVVAIPDRSPTPFALQTGSTYRFVAKVNEPRLRICMLLNGASLSGESYNLYLDDSTEPIPGQLNSSSEVDAPIPVSTSSVTIELPAQGIMRRLQLGHLDPVSETTGLQARLRQLGFYYGKVDGDFGPLSRAAVRAFRLSVKLAEDDKVDDDVRAALTKAYGS